MAGRFDLTEPDAVEQELATLFPWASDDKLRAAANLVLERLDLSGEQPAITDDILNVAVMTGSAVAYLVGPAPMPGGHGGHGPIAVGSLGSILRKVLPGLRHGGEHEPPTFYA